MEKKYKKSDFLNEHLAKGIKSREEIEEYISSHPKLFEDELEPKSEDYPWDLNSTEKKLPNLPEIRQRVSGLIWIAIIIVLFALLLGWKPRKENTGDSETNSQNIDFHPVTISNDDKSPIKLVYNDENRGYQFEEGDTILGHINHIDKANFKEEFVDKLNNGSEIPLIYNTANNINNSSKNIGIIIDNSYSFSKDGVLNKDLPAINLQNALNFLQQHGANNQTYKVGFVFSFGMGSEPIINMEYFTLTVDKSIFLPAITLKKGTTDKGTVDIKFSPDAGGVKGGIMNMHGGSFEVVYLKDGEKVSLDECIGSEKTFQCPSVQALANKLKASSTKYTSHSGFYLLDYLNIANGSVFYDLDEIYIFSDGEFQLQSSTSRDLLKNLNAKTAGIRENKADFPYNSKAKQYPTPQMNEITFNNNRIWIADYRKNAAEILNKHFVHCIEGRPNITFIGLNPEPTFNPFMATVYQQIFEGCDTHFTS